MSLDEEITFVNAKAVQEKPKEWCARSGVTLGRRRHCCLEKGHTAICDFSLDSPRAPENPPIPPKTEVKTEPKKRPVAALPTETPLGAAIRDYLLQCLSEGPFNIERVELLHSVVRESIPLLRALAGNGNATRNRGPLGLWGNDFAYSYSGLADFDFMDEMRRWSLGGPFKVARKFMKLVINENKVRLFNFMFGDRIRTEQQADIEGPLKAKCMEILKRPYTISSAKQLQNLLVAIAELFKTVGPAADHIPGGLRVSNTNYGNWATLPNPDDGFLESAPAFVTSSPAETFGANVVRELLALAPAFLASKTKTRPEDLVLAIATAEREGLKDVAADLRARLNDQLGAGVVETKKSDKRVAGIDPGVEGSVSMLVGGTSETGDLSDVQFVGAGDKEDAT